MVLNAVQIQHLTGTKQPLSFLDEVKQVKKGQSITAVTSVSMNESIFQGHFPGNPVMPGVLIIEALIQAAKIMFDDRKPSKLHLTKIKRARFRQMVRPGHDLTIKVQRKGTDGYVCEAKALLKDKVACSAELHFCLS